jgi:diacylglycerol kinase family enzyme
MEVGVITTPTSRKNRQGPRRAETLQAILGDAGKVYETQSIDVIKPVLREFLRQGARYWVADGGDGALHWMLRSGLEVLGEPEFADHLGVLPLTMPTNGGTIDFVASNVGICGNAESLMATLRGHVERDIAVDAVEVDSMAIDAIQIIDGEAVPLQTFGFAVAAGGIGQRFFSRYYQARDPNPRTIVKVVANTLASMPVALSPLARLPWAERFGDYARGMFEPTRARITLDGMVLPGDAFTGIHIASISINLGNLLRFFGKADRPGLMNAIVGTPSPWSIVSNLPRMARGREMVGRDIVDRPCRQLTLEATSDELLAPIIDGESYRDIQSMTFRLGPRVRIPRIVADAAATRRAA